METEEEFYESFRKELAEQYCYSVYAHIAPDGKRYIGYSKAVGRRWKSGEGYRKNKRFYEDILRIGWDNFEHVILKDELSLGEARELERRKILDMRAGRKRKDITALSLKCFPTMRIIPFIS